jgi:hypothetical protein
VALGPRKLDQSSDANGSAKRISAIEVLRKIIKISRRKDFSSSSEISARQLADNERVDPNFSPPKSLCQRSRASTEMIDPHRSIDQDQRRFLGLRRRTALISFSVPPRAANLLALSIAMRASRPACRSAVFSSRPVNLRAFSSKSSSKFSVVRICINMHKSDRWVKKPCQEAPNSGYGVQALPCIEQHSLKAVYSKPKNRRLFGQILGVLVSLW